MNFFGRSSQQSQISASTQAPFFFREPQNNFSIFSPKVEEIQEPQSSAWKMFNGSVKNEERYEDQEREDSFIGQLSQLVDQEDELLEIASKINIGKAHHILTDRQERQDKQYEKGIINEQEQQGMIYSQQAYNTHALKLNDQKKQIQKGNKLESNFSFGNRNFSNFASLQSIDQGYNSSDSEPVILKEIKGKQEKKPVDLAKSRVFKESKSSKPRTRSSSKSKSKQKQTLKQEENKQANKKLFDLLKNKDSKMNQQIRISSKLPDKIPQKPKKQDQLGLPSRNMILIQSKVSPFFKDSESTAYFEKPSQHDKQQIQKQKPRTRLQFNFRKSRVTENPIKPVNEIPIQKNEALRNSRVQKPIAQNIFKNNKFQLNNRNSTGKVELRKPITQNIQIVQEMKIPEKTVTKIVSNQCLELQKIKKDQQFNHTTKDKNNIDLKEQAQTKEVKKPIFSFKNLSNQTNSQKILSKNQNIAQEKYKINELKDDKSQNSSKRSISSQSSQVKEQSLGLKDQLKKIGGRLTEKLQIKSVAPKDNQPPKKMQSRFQGLFKRNEMKDKSLEIKKQLTVVPKISQVAEQKNEKPRLLLLNKHQDKNQAQHQDNVPVKIPVKVKSNFSKYMMQLMELQKEYEMNRIRSNANKNSYRQMAIYLDEMNRKLDYFISNKPFTHDFKT